MTVQRIAQRAAEESRRRFEAGEERLAGVEDEVNTLFELYLELQKRVQALAKRQPRSRRSRKKTTR